jgi:hypothetical protein
MWNERAEFDIYRSHVSGTTPHRRQIFDRSTNINQHFSCIFCQTPLEAHQGMSNQTPTSVNLTGNVNSTPIPTTPIRGLNRGSQPTMTNRSSTSSSSAYPPPPNSDMLMVCAKCRQVLPRCSICMMSLTTYIEDASNTYEPFTGLIFLFNLYLIIYMGVVNRPDTPLIGFSYCKEKTYSCSGHMREDHQ